MFAPESRPLRRPKLGIPDFYPQGEKQKEDELSHHALNSGFRLPMAVQDEVGSAAKDFTQHLNTKEYTTRINQVLDHKRRNGLVQDSTKRKLPVTKDNFSPVPLGRNRKEIAQSWFQDLASSKPLSTLSKKVPVFNKKEEIFENFCEKDVPIFRAVWYIKMTALYNSTIPDSKLNKKKQSNSPAFDWTLSLCHYMQERAWRANATNHSSSTRASTSSSAAKSSPSEESLEEVSRWKYMVNLSGWLYHENLLDKHEFLQWLVERVSEPIKPQDTRSLQLYLALVLKYLLDIGNCVSLSRSLVDYCTQKLTIFHDLNSRLQKSHQPPPPSLIPPPSSAADVQVKIEPPLQTHMETNEEEDSVFKDPPSIKTEPDQNPPAPQGREKRIGSTRAKKEATGIASEKPKNEDIPMITVNSEEGPPGEFHWCRHHQSLLIQLSCILQTIAIQCPTAFVYTRGKGKSGSLLSQLHTGLPQLMMPAGLDADLRKKLLQVLSATEQEILQRSKAAESGWSAVSVTDIQTTSEGANVQKVLKIIAVLDSHNFSSCRGHNPLTTLYNRIAAIQLEKEAPLRDDILVMLLCQWAVTPHRTGHHRPLVAAKLLSQRQAELLKEESWREWSEQERLDEAWEEAPPTPSGDIRDFPFQQILFKFLDSRAPLPEDLSTPVKPTDPFFQLVVLFSSLIHQNIFSYSLYLSSLIARGEVQSPIIPLLPFARDGENVFHPRPEPEADLSLSISIQALKKQRLDPGEQATPTGPISPTAASAFEIGGQQDISFSSALDMIGGGGAFIGEPESTAGKAEDVALLRQQQLESLLTADHENSRLVSPLPFHSHDDGPSSPINGVFLPFPSSGSLFMDEEQSIEISLNKQSQKHLLFSVYFPLSDAHLTKYDLNERSVVLCGVGKSRHRVERIVKNVMENVEHYFRLLSNVSSPVLPENPRCPDLMQTFCLLPTFEQRVIASECERRLRSSLRSEDGSSNSSICAQLIFVCELFEISGGIMQIIDLLVDVVTGDLPEQGGEGERSSLPLPLSPDLCVPVTCLLRKYLSCLLLSQQDTIAVFESLCHVLEGLRPPMKLTSSQRTVLLFLHHLYSNCIYLQKTCRLLFGPVLMQLEHELSSSASILTDSFPPTNSDTPFQRTNFPTLVTNPSECDIRKVCNFIRGTSFVSFPKTVCLFVMDVFAAVTQKSANSHNLCDLARVCAEVCCSVGSIVNKELMGAFRALCLPMTKLKFCATGYTSLTARTNILLDPGIQSNLISFAGLLVANGCFLLHDIISYIIQPIIQVQLTHQHNSEVSSIFLKFINTIILHLLVDDYINRPPSTDPHLTVHHPPFVRHCLHARARALNFVYLVSLLKMLLRLYHSLSRAVGGMRGGIQVIVQSDSYKMVLEEVHSTLETLASQGWLREKSSHHSTHLLEDHLLDGLTHSQARYLLNLLCPYSLATEKAPPLQSLTSTTAIEHVLKNLDQWTLRCSLLHINLHIAQCPPNSKMALLEELASQVIQVFEDSCGEEWLGQLESSTENGDGAFSPSVWLVTPLVSKLQQSVLGQVLKCAGIVLGQGQWWNPEKSQEKRRSTRATSGVAPPKTGLQWQQPFLELVLACMNVQSTTHEELLGPLRTQLQSFLTAFDKEGMPNDEQSKLMLYAALKLRLSLVGSMLPTIYAVEATTLEWTALLMQLICSGAVDRQTDSSELFTNCLDMLATLLHSLNPNFHICFAGSGEEGKKAYTTCIKKLKSELGNAKSLCISEIQQLFPLAQQPYEVITVKPPSFNLPKPPGEKITGLKVQDSREILPWDILEGIKNAGPLMLSWFGAVRMKRKPLKYIDQKRLVHFHTHQKRFSDIIAHRYHVTLPAPLPQNTISGGEPSGGAGEAETPTTTASKLPTTQPSIPDTSRRPPTSSSKMPAPMQPGTSLRPQKSAPPLHQASQQLHTQWSQRGPHVQPNKQVMNEKLQNIRQQQMERFGPYAQSTIGPYARPMQVHPQQPQMATGYNQSVLHHQQLKMKLASLPPEQQQIYLQRYRQQIQARQQQRQQAIINQQMMGQQFAPQYQNMGHPSMVPSMQAAPPMGMQQAMPPHGYQQQMVVRPQYAQHPGTGMGRMQQRPMY